MDGLTHRLCRSLPGGLHAVPAGMHPPWHWMAVACRLVSWVPFCSPSVQLLLLSLPPLPHQAKFLESVESRLAKHGPLLYQNASIAAGTSEWQQRRVSSKERFTEGGLQGCSCAARLPAQAASCCRWLGTEAQPCAVAGGATPQGQECRSCPLALPSRMKQQCSVCMLRRSADAQLSC